MLGLIKNYVPTSVLCPDLAHVCLVLLLDKRVICQTLGVLRDIVENISSEGTKSRQICYQSMQEAAQLSLTLFPVYIHQSGMSQSLLSYTKCPLLVLPRCH